MNPFPRWHGVCRERAHQAAGEGAGGKAVHGRHAAREVLRSGREERSRRGVGYFGLL